MRFGWLNWRAMALCLAVITAANPARAQYRGGSDPGLTRFRQATDPRRFAPSVIPPGSRIGPRADGTRVRVLQGPGSNVPLGGIAPGTVADGARTVVGEAQSGQPAVETILPTGFRDQGRVLAPAAHLQRFPPPPNQPAFPPQFTVNFPSRRDGYYAPDLVRDQNGATAFRTRANRAEERNAFQR